MALQEITLRLPDNLYQRLTEAAKASHKTIDDVVVQSIRVGLPPGVEHIPERFRTDLQTLTQMSDAMLWQMAQIDLDNDKSSLYNSLLTKNQRNLLDETEHQTLISLREEADLLMFRRSYAYALLKWRGHRILTLSELSHP